jgi:glycerol-3-phosphate O-acyltransferase
MTTSEPSARAVAVSEPPVDSVMPERSSMVVRFGVLAQMLVSLTFRHVTVSSAGVERVQGLAERHPVVYVMRYRSVVDYLLVNAVLLREGLPLARFAPGMSTVWWRPIREILRWVGRRRQRARRPAAVRCADLVRAGQPVLLFMRSRTVAGRRRRALAAARIGTRFLREVARTVESGHTPIVVPVAIFRGSGPRRRESRFATLVYSVQEAPGEARRLVTYLWNAEQIRLVFGREIGVRDFMASHGDESEERAVRRLVRTLQIELHREERVVHGPALLPRRLVRQQVLRDPELARLTRQLASTRKVPRQRVVREARRYIDEMAANFNGIYFGVLEYVFNRIWPRVFSGLEIKGLERVAECVKDHPVVLVPCHRSHFDYLILTYIFHINYLSPPHIAAGINLSFWPMGPLFRGAGAFFIRRSFADNELYKMVFRKYLGYLIREGYTQEFFIEGGRTRTGKLLPPKLGMLSAIVDAFASGARRDLYLVPVSIHYGRIPEEESYKREVTGEEKQRESLWALLRARRVLSRRFGTVYVTYAQPISLGDTLGDERRRFARGDHGNEAEGRAFVEGLAYRLLREVNAATVAGATSVSAAALLGAPSEACRESDFRETAEALIALLRVQGVDFTASLRRNIGSEFRESLGWLEAGGLVARLTDARGAVLQVPIDKRPNLDFYKNSILHFFLVPALLTQALRRGVAVAEVVDYVARWLTIYRWEFPQLERVDIEQEVGHWLSHYEEAGALQDGRLQEGRALVRATEGLLESVRESYLVALQTVASRDDWPIARPSLIRAMRKQFATSLLLGEVTKPEGSSVVTFGNALSRLEELGCITVGSGRQARWIERGPHFGELPRLLEELQS